MNAFIQSYENRTVLDSSILIAPLVFFIAPCDPRFVRTLGKILLPPEKGGLTSTGLVFRYNTDLSDDGMSTTPSRIEALPRVNAVKLTRERNPNQASEGATVPLACVHSGLWRP